MSFRFRQGIRIAKGVRLNIGKTGVSLSLGGRGATVNVGKKGIKGTIGIPGSGISYSAPLTANDVTRVRRERVPVIGQPGSGVGVLVFMYLVLAIWYLFIR